MECSLCGDTSRILFLIDFLKQRWEKNVVDELQFHLNYNTFISSEVRGKIKETLL